MSIEEKQTGRYSKDELNLIEATFKNNDALIYALRKVFLQGVLNETDIKVLKTEVKGKVLDIVEKEFVPLTLDLDSPLFQLADLYVSLYGEIKEKSVEYSYPMILAKQLEVDYLVQQFDALKCVIKSDIMPRMIRLDDMTKIKGKTAEEMYVNLTARNYLLSFVDSHLNALQIMAGNELAKGELTKKVQKQNSTK